MFSRFIAIASSSIYFTVILILSGCATPIGSTLDATSILALNNQARDNKIYLLGIADIINVKSYYNQKLNDEIAIRPDGRISLQLIGDVQAAGLSPAQLGVLVTTEYTKYFKSSDNKYVLGIGDIIAVKFYFDRELNDEVIVRPDGKISLQLVGEIQTAGLTPAQLNSELYKAYSKVFDSPEITVIVKDFKLPEISVSVKEYASRKVYVGGEIAKPGIIPITGSMRIFDAITQAGGTLDTAELETVVLLRHDGSSKPNAYSLNLNKVLNGETSDVTLMPYDVVYIPKTKIAKLDLFVDQYFNKLIPRQVAFPFTYNMNPEVQIQK
jgi:polysaccharide biosynthesis/export protein